MWDPSKTFEDWVVWRKAHPFVLAVYRLTQSFPRSEIYGLSSQFRRAVVSIAAISLKDSKSVESRTAYMRAILNSDS